MFQNIKSISCVVFVLTEEMSRLVLHTQQAPNHFSSHSFVAVGSDRRIQRRKSTYEEEVHSTPSSQSNSQAQTPTMSPQPIPMCSTLDSTELSIALLDIGEFELFESYPIKPRLLPTCSKTDSSTSSDDSEFDVSSYTRYTPMCRPRNCDSGFPAFVHSLSSLKPQDRAHPRQFINDIAVEEQENSRLRSRTLSLQELSSSRLRSGC